MTDLVCWKCGASLEDVPRPLTRQSNCKACYAVLYCCRMCRKYDTRYTSKCNDERTHPPLRKDTANFCDYFRPSAQSFEDADKAAADAASADLKALFGETGDDSAGTADTNAELEALFGADESSDRDR